MYYRIFWVSVINMYLTRLFYVHNSPILVIHRQLSVFNQNIRYVFNLDVQYFGRIFVFG